MDCLEVRRALATDPNSQDPDVLEHVSQCDDCARAFATSLRFERALRDAMKVSVPENLASRILLKQSFEERERTSRWLRWPGAAAAAVLLTAGLLTLLLLRPQELDPRVEAPQVDGLDQEVVALVEAAEYALQAKGPVAHDTVNEALSPIGLGLTRELRGVTFASRCLLRGKMAGHLVLKGERAPITVFLIPHERIEAEAPIAEADWAGRLLPADEGTIAVVAAPGESLDNVVRMVRNAVNWRA